MWFVLFFFPALILYSVLCHVVLPTTKVLGIDLRSTFSAEEQHILLIFAFSGTEGRRNKLILTVIT